MSSGDVVDVTGIDESLYLLQDVYPSVDNTGPLRPYESAVAQRDRIAALSADPESTTYLRALLGVSDKLAEDAAKGELEDLHERLLGLRQDEVLFPALDKCLFNALANGHVHVAEYIRRRGFPLPDIPSGGHTFQSKDKTAAPLLEALISRLIDVWCIRGEDWDGEEASGRAQDAELTERQKLCFDLSTAKWKAFEEKVVAATTAKDTLRSVASVVAAELQPLFTALNVTDVEVQLDGKALATPMSQTDPTEMLCTQTCLPAHHAATLLFATLVCGGNPNFQRKPDGYTPLHLACAAGRLDLAAALAAIGADVNAVAEDESTPLSVALNAQKEASTPQEAAQTWNIITILRAFGAVESWKDAMSAPAVHKPRVNVVAKSSRSSSPPLASLPTLGHAMSTRPKARSAEPVVMASFSGGFNAETAARAYAEQERAGREDREGTPLVRTQSDHVATGDTGAVTGST